MDSTLLLIIVQILLFGILYFLLKNVLPAYFSEKGKNIATKEDISEITEKIKTVESKINIKTNSEIDYNSLKRKIILDFFGAFNHLETLLLRNQSDFDNEAKNLGFVEKINDAKFNYNLKEGELELFLKDKSFFKITNEINLVILELHHKMETHCFEVINIIKQEDDLQTRYDKIGDSKKNYHNHKMAVLESTFSLRSQLISYLENELHKSFV